MLKLIVIIPALNEEKTIAKVLADIPSDIDSIDIIQTIVVDDGSTDDTARIAQENDALVISHNENKGVGAAFATGIKSALENGADVIVNMDGDGQFNPADIPELIEPIISRKAGFVTCSRFGKKEFLPKMPLIKYWGNQWMVKLINTVTDKNFTDVSCGFRAYSRETALRLNLFGQFTYTQETFLDLAQKNIIMTEIPLKVRGEREFGKSRVANSISKYAIRAGSIIMLAVRDSKPLMFFGSMGMVSTILGVVLGGFVFVHWLMTSMTSPYQSLITGSTLLLILGFLLIVLAFLADMLGRMRQNQEEILYLLRKKVYEDHKD
jgi:glycosyltransferase involved in cell wall biosynthesis